MSDGDKSKRTRAVVDRVEDGGTAVVLFGEGEGESVDLPVSLLPEGAAEGSHLFIDIGLDEDSRREAEESARALQEKLERRTGARGQKNFKL